MRMMPIITEIRKEGKVPYFTRIEHGTIPSEEEWRNFIPTEDILMIGYPNGLWDKINGLPFFKKGMTATHPYINYNGREEFVMDVSVYPGSSGSPVLLLTNEFYAKSRTFQGGSDHARLLGIAYKHFKYNNKSKSFENSNISNQATSFPPIDLGIAIRSTKLIDFETIYPTSFWDRKVKLNEFVKEFLEIVELESCILMSPDLIQYEL